jgi:hypothetical protein
MSSTTTEQSTFQTRVNSYFEEFLDDEVKTFIRAILTYNDAKDYAAFPIGSPQPAPHLLKTAKHIREVQEQCRNILQEIISELQGSNGPVLVGVVLTAIATFLLKEATHEVEIEKKKLSTSAYDFTEWLLQTVDHQELSDFRDKQLGLREQRRLEFQLKNASVSGDSGKPKTRSGACISKESTPQTRTCTPDRDPPRTSDMQRNAAATAVQDSLLPDASTGTAESGRQSSEVSQNSCQKSAESAGAK